MSTIPMQSERLVFIVHFSSLSTVVTIGFERPSYTFSEPSAGSSRVTELVCVSVTRGSVGTRLMVAADWTPGTAFGENIWLQFRLAIKCDVIIYYYIIYSYVYIRN